MRPSVHVRPADSRDIDFVVSHGHLARQLLERKIACNEILIAEIGGSRVGHVRVEYLWSVVPYLGLVHVEPAHRRQGVGRALLAAVANRFLAEGHDAFYSSSQADELEPQTWHRHMGFVDCGFLGGVNAGGVDEVFFRKVLR